MPLPPPEQRSTLPLNRLVWNTFEVSTTVAIVMIFQVWRLAIGNDSSFYLGSSMPQLELYMSAKLQSLPRIFHAAAAAAGLTSPNYIHASLAPHVAFETLTQKFPEIWIQFDLASKHVYLSWKRKKNSYNTQTTRNRCGCSFGIFFPNQVGAFSHGTLYIWMFSHVNCWQGPRSSKVLWMSKGGLKDVSVN